MLGPIRYHIRKLSPLIYEDCMGEPAQTLTLDLLCNVSFVFPGGYEVTCLNRRAINVIHGDCVVSL
jgi:hypothetical protein